MLKLARVMMIVGMYQFPAAAAVLAQRWIYASRWGEWQGVPVSNLLGAVPGQGASAFWNAVYALPLDVVFATLGLMLMGGALLLARDPNATHDDSGSPPDIEEGLTW